MLPHTLILSVALALYIGTVIRATGILSAAAVFAYVQSLLAFGTFRLLDLSREPDVIYGAIFLAGILIYLLVSGTLMLHRPPAIRVNGSWKPKPPTTKIFKPNLPFYALLGVSALIVLAYYQAVGHSALIAGIQNSISGGDEDIAGLRIDSYSGSNYLYPGYVNQFKNVLLPSLTVLAVTYWSREGNRRPAWTVLLIGVSVFGLIGTGQRGAFVQFSITLIVFLYLLHGRSIPKRIILFVGAIIGMLLLSTLALGRTESSSSASPLERSGTLFLGLLKRFTEEQQSSGLTGFRFVYGMPTQWGAEWLTSFTGILPGATGSSLASEIFESVYGSDRGTMTPSIWASIYHNFGWLGVLIFPAIMGLVLAYISRKANSYQEINTLQLIGISGVISTFGIWATSSPVFLLNNGLIVYIFLWWWGNRITIPKAASSASRPS